MGPIKGAIRPLVRILVVDNDSAHLKHITVMLRMAGIDCVAAASSADALDKFRVLSPDMRHGLQVFPAGSVAHSHAVLRRCQLWVPLKFVQSVF